MGIFVGGALVGWCRWGGEERGEMFFSGADVLDEVREFGFHGGKGV